MMWGEKDHLGYSRKPAKTVSGERVREERTQSKLVENVQHIKGNNFQWKLKDGNIPEEICPQHCNMHRICISGQ